MNKTFWWLFSILIISAGCFIIIQGKDDSFLLVNQLGREEWDAFFTAATLLGDGRFTILFCLLMLFVSYKRWIQSILCMAVPSLITTILKRLVFYDIVRPKLHFQVLQKDFYSVDGVSLLVHHSFPSGHTTAAFAVFTFLALINKRPPLDVLFLVLAVLAAWSRIYLGQHFFVDVFFGALIGTLFCALCFILTERLDLDKKYPILSRSILRK